MLTFRIIPCLDVKDGRTVKGVNFVNLADAGDPVELGALYRDEGADELVYLDITATHEKRKTLVSLVTRVAATLNIPFTVGGGIGSIADVEVLLQAGADKISVNSSAVYHPGLIGELAYHFGSQCVVLAVDARKTPEGTWQVHTHGGRKATDKELFSWVKEAEDRGAGEILFTSMDHDGTRQGYALEALAHISEQVEIPVIASGGAGKPEDFYDAWARGKADAALAAGLFHYKELSIKKLKEYLKKKGVPVRL
ncbi:MAG TPA: imidazole glycerol phosphate synthase subunit HisF [Bacteroidetes bacterium]|nr:imidazole glycerol phosphate synthase subunit HisF [Bacteroidota bacterium]